MNVEDHYFRHFVMEHLLKTNDVRKIEIVFSRSRDVFGIGENKKPYKQLAEEFNISAARARQIAIKAALRIRVLVEAMGALSKEKIHVKIVEVKRDDIKDHALIQRLSVRDLAGYQNLSCRLRNVLHYWHMELLSVLLDKTKLDILYTPNCGRKSLNELIAFLAMNGLTLKHETRNNL